MMRGTGTTASAAPHVLLLLAAVACSTDPGSVGGLSAGQEATGTGGTGTAGPTSGPGTASGTGGATAGDGPIFDLGPFPDLGGRCPPDDPECAYCEPEFEVFDDPVLKCSWTDAATLTTPVVADLDADGGIEIAFVAMGSAKGQLVVIRGDDCTVEYEGPADMLGMGTQIAAADLDGDGDYEVAGLVPDGLGLGTHRLRVLDHTGTEVAVSEETAAVQADGVAVAGGPAIVDLDGQAPPEIVYGGMAVRLSGNNLVTLYNQPVPSAHLGILTTVADVDLDGTPELVTGTRIFDGVTGADETPPNVADFAPGYPAIGQFDPETPEPEVVLVSSTTNPTEVRIYNPVTGGVLMGPITFGPQEGGAPTVGDFDGDGRPEVAVAAFEDYLLIDPDCDANPLPAFCVEPGIRWRKPIQDETSGSTGSTLFDFNGDGVMEVVYRDEVKLRIYDGPTGDVLSSFDIGSGTSLENPVVADVDLDGRAELVVPAHAGLVVRGIYVLEDPQDKWMPARSIWNQHTYHVTNISEDGTVPPVETNNWTVWNNFRQQVGPDPEGKKPCKPKPEG